MRNARLCCRGGLGIKTYFLEKRGTFNLHQPISPAGEGLKSESGLEGGEREEHGRKKIGLGFSSGLFFQAWAGRGKGKKGRQA